MKAWRHFRALLGREPWWAELSSAIGILLLSIALLTDLMDLQGQLNWRYLSLLVSDEACGAITFLLGMAQFAAVGTDHKWGRIIMAFGAALFWLTLTHSLWLGNHATPGTVPFLMLGVQNLASVLLIRLRPQPRWHDA